jgi:hypothetical protein
MKVIIREKPDSARVVRVEINTGAFTSAREVPCDNDEQARIYAQGLVDGARAAREEMDLPFGYIREQERAD